MLMDWRLIFSSYTMIPGEIYEFKADGVSGSHPFMIGESVGDIAHLLLQVGL